MIYSIENVKRPERVVMWLIGNRRHLSTYVMCSLMVVVWLLSLRYRLADYPVAEEIPFPRSRREQTLYRLPKPRPALFVTSWMNDCNLTIQICCLEGVYSCGALSVHRKRIQDTQVTLEENVPLQA